MEILLLEFNYGNGYTAAVQKDNIFGVQFHPEKSGDGGKLILKILMIYNVKSKNNSNFIMETP